jgi:hypothetical protein
MKCPLCGTEKYKTSCLNVQCDLYVEPKQFDVNEVFDYIWRKAKFFSRYPDEIFKRAYWNIRHIVFDRYDLIRTGLPKNQWIDKDVLIEEGLMQLLCDFVEGEKALQWYYDVPDKTVNGNDIILKLYTDIKVELPRLKKEYNKTFDEYTDSFTAVFGEREPVSTNSKLRSTKLEFVYHQSKEYTEAKRKLHEQSEEILEAFKTDILHRIVDIRHTLWA